MRKGLSRAFHILCFFDFRDRQPITLYETSHSPNPFLWMASVFPSTPSSIHLYEDPSVSLRLSKSNFLLLDRIFGEILYLEREGCHFCVCTSNRGSELPTNEDDAHLLVLCRLRHHLANSHGDPALSLSLSSEYPTNVIVETVCWDGWGEVGVGKEEGDKRVREALALAEHRC